MKGRGKMMIIDGNEKEKKSMAAYRRGDKEEAVRLQEEFLEEFREEYAKKDHCSCQKVCVYHGNCKECVVIHRAHGDHLPNCMRAVVNEKIRVISELTEHSIANEIEAPKETLR